MTVSRKQQQYSPSFVAKLQYLLQEAQDAAATLRSLDNRDLAAQAAQVYSSLYSAARKSGVPVRSESGTPHEQRTPSGTYVLLAATLRTALAAIQPLRLDADVYLRAAITDAGIKIANLASRARQEAQQVPVRSTR